LDRHRENGLVPGENVGTMLQKAVDALRVEGSFEGTAYPSPPMHHDSSFGAPVSSIADDS